MILIEKSKVLRAIDALLGNKTIQGGCERALVDLKVVILQLPTYRTEEKKQ